MIESIKELRAELQFEVLAQIEPLRQGQVNILEARPFQNISACIPVGSAQRNHECIRIEVPVGAARNHLAGESGIQGWPDRVAGVAVIGGIESQLGRKGQTGLDRTDPADLPVRNQIVPPGVSGGTWFLTKRQVVRCIDGEAMANVKRRTAVIIVWPKRILREGVRGS